MVSAGVEVILPHFPIGIVHQDTAVRLREDCFRSPFDFLLGEPVSRDCGVEVAEFRDLI